MEDDEDEDDGEDKVEVESEGLPLGGLPSWLHVWTQALAKNSDLMWSICPIISFNSWLRIYDNIRSKSKNSPNPGRTPVLLYSLFSYSKAWRTKSNLSSSFVNCASAVNWSSYSVYKERKLAVTVDGNKEPGEREREKS